jgi:hypothetical protein
MGLGMVLRAVSFDIDLDAQQNDEPAKDSRSLAPPECRSRDRDKGYPAVNIADALCAFCVELGMERRDRFVCCSCIALKVKGQGNIPAKLN